MNIESFNHPQRAQSAMKDFIKELLSSYMLKWIYEASDDNHRDHQGLRSISPTIMNSEDLKGSTEGRLQSRQHAQVKFTVAIYHKSKSTNDITEETHFKNAHYNLIIYHATFVGIAFSMFDGISMLNPSAAVDKTIPGI